LSGYDELWSAAAVADVQALPTAVRDQVEALVREICRDPSGRGSFEPPDVPRTRVRDAGLLAVQYQVDELDRLVYIRRVTWRG
jgi:hypothetical protein